MASKIKIDLYYDVISPYSWIAFESLLRYQHVWPIEVNLKPCSLRGIMMGSGNKPPGVVMNKAIYMMSDLRRNNEFWNMNMSPPKDFMKLIKTETSDNAMKLLLIIQKERPEKLEIASREFWKRIWSNGEMIFRRPDFEKVLAASGITNAPHYIDQIDSSLATALLEQNTKAALDSGAFGAPWIVVHKDGEEHPFFGSDRLHLIAHLIGQKFTDGLVQYSKL
uniref:Glutathione S-transferase kappa n=1 Tax=Haemonchus contortus TaxID=6289 RepID=W6NAR6_HAECO